MGALIVADAVAPFRFKLTVCAPGRGDQLPSGSGPA